MMGVFLLFFKIFREYQGIRQDLKGKKLLTANFSLLTEKKTFHQMAAAHGNGGWAAMFPS